METNHSYIMLLPVHYPDCLMSFCQHVHVPMESIFFLSSLQAVAPTMESLRLRTCFRRDVRETDRERVRARIIPHGAGTKEMRGERGEIDGWTA